MESRELNLDLIRGPQGSDQDILTDEHNSLGALQEKQGAHHWLGKPLFSFLCGNLLKRFTGAVMRDVLPDVHWETY